MRTPCLGQGAAVLNDLAWPTRLLLIGFGVVTGTFVGMAFAGDDVVHVWWLMLAAGGLQIVVLGVFVVFLSIAEGGFRAEVRQGSHELAGGLVAGRPALGHVVRQRPSRAGWFLPGRHQQGPAVLTVLTVIGDGAPRRAAALVPPGLGLRGRGAAAALVVHPTRPEVVLVDDRVPPGAGLHLDPARAAARVPTDRTVVGGWTALLVAFAGAVGLTALGVVLLARSLAG